MAETDNGTIVIPDVPREAIPRLMDAIRSAFPNTPVEGPVVVDGETPAEQTPNDGLLTGEEREALELTARLGNMLNAICRRDQYHPVGDQDWAEAAGHIHNLQHMIMSQAAARAYPTQFRRLGQTLR